MTPSWQHFSWLSLESWFLIQYKDVVLAVKGKGSPVVDFTCLIFTIGIQILLRRHTYIESTISLHDDVIKWKHFPCNWPFMRVIHRWPVNSPHKGQWRGALMFSLICPWINAWVNNGEAGDLRRNRTHYDVTVMNDFYHNSNTWVEKGYKLWEYWPKMSMKYRERGQYKFLYDYLLEFHYVCTGGCF